MEFLARHPDERGTPFSSRQRLQDIVIGLVGFVALAAFYWHRITYSVAHPIAADCLLGTDTTIRVAALLDDPRRFLSWGLPRRHALTVIPTLIIGGPLRLLGWSEIQAVAMAMAVSQAAGFVFLFAFFRRRGCPPVHAAAGAILCALTFGAVTTGSALDSYGLTFAAISAVFCLMNELVLSVPDGRIRTLIAGLLGAVAGLGNAPATIFALLLPAFAAPGERGTVTLRRIASVCLISGLIVVSIPILLEIYHRDAGITNFIAENATLRNFITLDVPRYLVSFFLFPLVAPIDHVASGLLTEMTGGYVERPLSLVALVGIVGLIGRAVIRLVRDPGGRRMVLFFGLALAGLFVFHVYFDPEEVAMFSVEWILLLLVPVVLTTVDRAWSRASILALTVVFAIVNVPPLYLDEVQTRAARCSPT